MRIRAQMTGKVAIVIGAATRDNMGQEIASKLAGAGAKVMAAGRNADELTRISAAIGGAYRTFDVTDSLDLATLMSAPRPELGGTDSAVNKPGGHLRNRIRDVYRDDPNRVLSVHLPVTFL